jgi:hypothetical protein
MSERAIRKLEDERSAAAGRLRLGGRERGKCRGKRLAPEHALDREGG